MGINVSEKPAISIFRLNMGHQVPPNIGIIYKFTRAIFQRTVIFHTAMRASKLTR
jgi:hypothetical protein